MPPPELTPFWFFANTKIYGIWATAAWAPGGGIGARCVYTRSSNGSPVNTCRCVVTLTRVDVPKQFVANGWSKLAGTSKRHYVFLIQICA
jgi:hypothetical protein